MSISGIQHGISRAFADLWRLLEEGRLPRSLELLGLLAPHPGHECKVQLCRTKGRQERQIRCDADASYWSPQEGLVARLVYGHAGGLGAEPVNPRGDGVGPTAVEDSVDGRLNLVIELVRVAARRRHFVGLTWLRDHLIPKAGQSWSDDPAACRAAVEDAIERGVLLIEKVHNPKNPEHPTSAVKLNQDHPLVTSAVERGSHENEAHPHRRRRHDRRDSHEYRTLRLLERTRRLL